MQIVINGLRHDIRSSVILAKPKILDEVRENAVLAEAALGHDKPMANELMSAIAKLKLDLQQKKTASINAVNATKPLTPSQQEHPVNKPRFPIGFQAQYQPRFRQGFQVQ